jgi:hypothetical protein
LQIPKLRFQPANYALRTPAQSSQASKPACNTGHGRFPLSLYFLRFGGNVLPQARFLGSQRSQRSLSLLHLSTQPVNISAQRPILFHEGIYFFCGTCSIPLEG